MTGAPSSSLPATTRLQTRGGTLEYALSGAGDPVLVLLNGAGMTLDGWGALYPAIEEIGTVFAWNRFGLEGSDAPHAPQSGAVVVASLRELLAYAGLRPPYVLVAHSFGGLYANLFARMYPQEVAGVLFLEATHPGDDEVTGQQESQVTRALAKVLSVPERLFRQNLHAEIEAAKVVVREIDSAGPFPDIPVSVITGAGRPPRRLLSQRALLARRVHQEALARLSPRGEQVVAARSGHFPQMTEPELVLQVIEDLRAKVERERLIATPG